jgi:hypothetical protein
LMHLSYRHNSSLIRVRIPKVQELKAAWYMIMMIDVKVIICSFLNNMPGTMLF